MFNASSYTDRVKEVSYNEELAKLGYEGDNGSGIGTLGSAAIGAGAIGGGYGLHKHYLNKATKGHAEELSSMASKHEAELGKVKSIKSYVAEAARALGAGAATKTIEQTAARTPGTSTLDLAKQTASHAAHSATVNPKVQNAYSKIKGTFNEIVHGNKEGPAKPAAAVAKGKKIEGLDLRTPEQKVGGEIASGVSKAKDVAKNVFNFGRRFIKKADFEQIKIAAYNDELEKISGVPVSLRETAKTFGKELTQRIGERTDTAKATVGYYARKLLGKPQKTITGEVGGPTIHPRQFGEAIKQFRAAGRPGTFVPKF